MKTFALCAAIFAGGYVASVYSWTWLHAQVIGAKEKAVQLRAQAIALENKLRGK